MNQLQKRVEDASRVTLTNEQFEFLLNFADRIVGEHLDSDVEYYLDSHETELVFTMVQLLKFNNEWSNV